MQLVMKHVPGCSAADVDEMIKAIDRQDYKPGYDHKCSQKKKPSPQPILKTHRNGDGRISFSEFRVMMGGYPLVTSQPKKIPNIIKQK